MKQQPLSFFKDAMHTLSLIHICDLTLLYENFIKGKTIAKGTLAGLIIAAVIPVSYTHLDVYKRQG